MVLKKPIGADFASVLDTEQQEISSGGILNYMAMAVEKHYDTSKVKRQTVFYFTYY
jgi:hypothetical protein